MRNEMLSIYQNRQSDELYYPTLKQYESEINMLIIDEPIILYKEFEQLVEETQEYGFWMAKNPTVLPDYQR